MKSNAEQLKVKFAHTSEESGMARQEIRKFLHKYTWASQGGTGIRAQNLG